MEKESLRPACLAGEEGEGGEFEREQLAIPVIPEQLYVLLPKNGHLIVYLTTYFSYAYKLEDLGYTPEISHRSGIPLACTGPHRRAR